MFYGHDILKYKMRNNIIKYVNLYNNDAIGMALSSWHILHENCGKHNVVYL